MAEKMYVCGYKHCLYPNEKVKDSESVVIGKRHYHTDCAELRKNIKECTELYMEKIEDKTIYPAAVRIISTMIFKNRIPVNYIKNDIKHSQLYYSTKPVMVLYGIRKKFYKEMEKELNARR
jgi:hypothetical protein